MSITQLDNLALMEGEASQSIHLGSCGFTDIKGVVGQDSHLLHWSATRWVVFYALVFNALNTSEQEEKCWRDKNVTTIRFLLVNS